MPKAAATKRQHLRLWLQGCRVRRLFGTGYFALPAFGREKGLKSRFAAASFWPSIYFYFPQLEQNLHNPSLAASYSILQFHRIAPLLAYANKAFPDMEKRARAKSGDGSDCVELVGRTPLVLRPACHATVCHASTSAKATLR